MNACMHVWIELNLWMAGDHLQLFLNKFCLTRFLRYAHPLLSASILLSTLATMNRLLPHPRLSSPMPAHGWCRIACSCLPKSLPFAPLASGENLNWGQYLSFAIQVLAKSCLLSSALTGWFALIRLPLSPFPQDSRWLLQFWCFWLQEFSQTTYCSEQRLSRHVAILYARIFGWKRSSSHLVFCPYIWSFYNFEYACRRVFER